MRAHLRAALVLAPLGLVLCQAGPARAGGLQFDPVYLHLNTGQPTTTLRLRNRNDKPMRYQVTPYAWAQSPQGQMQLSPTEEVLLFPMLFTLVPNEERIVRVGTTAAFGAAERTYRVVIDEFPEGPGAAAKGASLQIRSRVVLPVFLDPAQPVATAVIHDAAVRGTSLEVELRSTGNAHLLLKGVKATALDGAGAALYDHSWGPAYLLASGSLQLKATAPKDLCARVRSIRVEAENVTAPDVRADPLSKTVAVRGACPR